MAAKRPPMVERLFHSGSWAVVSCAAGPGWVPALWGASAAPVAVAIAPVVGVVGVVAAGAVPVAVAAAAPAAGPPGVAPGGCAAVPGPVLPAADSIDNTSADVGSSAISGRSNRRWNA